MTQVRQKEIKVLGTNKWWKYKSKHRHR